MAGHPGRCPTLGLRPLRSPRSRANDRAGTTMSRYQLMSYIEPHKPRERFRRSRSPTGSHRGFASSAPVRPAPPPGPEWNDRILTKASGVELAWDGLGDARNEAILLISGLGTQMIRRGRGPFARHSPQGGIESSASTSGILAAPSIQPINGQRDRACSGERICRPHPFADLDQVEHGQSGPASSTPNVTAMMMHPTHDPSIDPGSFLVVSLAFAHRITGTTYLLDKDAHRALLLEAAKNCYNSVSHGHGDGKRPARASGDDHCADARHLWTDDPIIPRACGHDMALSILNAI